MPLKRRTSSQRMKIRSEAPKTEQATLHDCPACEKAGSVSVMSETGGRYSWRTCGLCEGNGMVDAKTLKAWIRLGRIRDYRREHGKCG